MKRAWLILAGATLAVCGTAWADRYDDTVQLFKAAGQSSAFFGKSYGYAVFPTVGKGGFVVGAAYGEGRVYERGRHIGDASLAKVSVGFQAGGQVYSQVIFFQDKRALDEFTSGNFEFAAGASAVAITAAAGAEAGTTGANAAASVGRKDATTAGNYYKGMAVFTIVQGGAMYEASIAGQKYTYKPGSK